MPLPTVGAAPGEHVVIPQHIAVAHVALVSSNNDTLGCSVSLAVITGMMHASSGYAVILGTCEWRHIVPPAKHK